MKVLGIDPGLSGGAAVLQTEPRLRVVDAVDMPTVLDGAKRRVDVRWLFAWLLQHAPDVGFVERAQAMPARGRHGREGEEEWRGQGASSAFIYGRATGAQEATALCAGVRLHLVEPGVWKRAAGLLKRDKEASRQMVLRLFPKDAFLFQLKRHERRAEAVLIARHGIIKMNLPRGPDEEPITTKEPAQSSSAGAPDAGRLDALSRGD